jgi:arginine N-succinyltransferase
MLLVRPVRLEDHAEILTLAKKAGIGMTSLPPDPDVLQAKIERSVSSFAGSSDAGKERRFLFVLEDTDSKALVGTTGIAAHVGLSHPFYSYKLSTIVQASGELDIYSLQRVLHMVNDYTGATEIGSLFLLPEYRRDNIGRFLSRCRFLMLAQFPELFSDVVIAEIRGVQDEDGDSPFYKNLAQHFFQMDFQQADFTNATQGGQFISDLMPKYPIYVNLLAPKAQEAIGKPFKASLPALQLLKAEGFRHQGYIDVFDAGPTMQADRGQIRTVAQSKFAKLERIIPDGDVVASTRHMIATARMPEFCLTYAPIQEIAEGRVAMCQQTADTLNLSIGDGIRYL